MKEFYPNREKHVIGLERSFTSRSIAKIFLADNRRCNFEGKKMDSILNPPTLTHYANVGTASATIRKL